MLFAEYGVDKTMNRPAETGPLEIKLRESDVINALYDLLVTSVRAQTASLSACSYVPESSKQPHYDLRQAQPECEPGG